MLELNWYLPEATEENKKPSRKEVISWNMKMFSEIRGTSLLLKDKFYLRELIEIKKNYPRLHVYVGGKTNEDSNDKRHWCIIEKVV